MPSIVALVPVELDKPRQLLFTRAAVKNIELALTRIWGRDYTFFEGVRRLSEMLLDIDLSKLSFINIAVMLHQGCLHEDPALTLAEVEEALPYADPTGLIPYAGLILQAWRNASPQVVVDAVTAEAEAADTDPLAVSTGASSGPLNGPVLGSVRQNSGA
jgi:hypothetical protein